MSILEVVLNCLFITVLIAISGFFSGTETAMTAASRSRLMQWHRNGSKRAKTALDLLENLESLIGSLLIGNNFVNILSSVLATNIFIHFFGEGGVFITTIVMTIIVVIFAEVLPKVYALSNPDKITVFISPIIKRIVLVLKPFNLAIIFVCDNILKFFNVLKNTNASSLKHEEELRGAIELHDGEDPDYKQEREMLRSVMELDDTNVEDAMTHRSTVVTLDINMSIHKILSTVLESPFSLFPVTDGTENIIGVIHDKKFLSAHRRAFEEKKAFDPHKVIEKAWFVPENTSMLTQLQAFRDKGSKMSIVIDEYGTYMGVITLTDILEYIVGDISQEDNLQPIKQISGNTFLVNGDEIIRNVNRELDWHIPDDNASTIVGYILHEARVLPNEGQTFIFGHYRFVIAKRIRQQITKVQVSKIS